MEINETIESMKQNINNAYNTISAKDGVVPENKNLENLSMSILSIPTGSGESDLKIYKSIQEVDTSGTLTPSSSMEDLVDLMSVYSYLICSPGTYVGLLPNSVQNTGTLEVIKAESNNTVAAVYTIATSQASCSMYYGEMNVENGSENFVWEKSLNLNDVDTTITQSSQNPISSSAVYNALLSKLNSTPDGTNALINSNNKLNLVYIPDSILGQVEYMGEFSSQLPSSPEKGWYYIYNGASPLTIEGETYETGDWAIYNGTKWDKVDNTDAVQSVAGKTGAVILNKSDVGLGNVDNTSDLDKPISTATQNALNAKQDEITGGATTILDDNLSPNLALISSSNGKVSVSSVTATELGYLSGVTSSVQNQINDKLDTDGDASNTTVDFVEALARVNIVSGENQSTSFGKIKKFFADLQAVAFSGSYTDLTDKPTIPVVNDGVLTVQRNGVTIGTFSANQIGDALVDINVPTQLSELSNDSTHMVVTSSQIDSWNSKQDEITGAATSIVASNLSSDIVVVTDSNGKIGSSNISSSELLCLNGASDNIQAQINGINSNMSLKLDSNGNSSQTTVSFVESGTRVDLTTGDNLSTLVGKTQKWFSDLGNLAFQSVVQSGEYAPNSITSSDVDNTIAKTADIPTVNNGILTLKRNGISLGTFSANQSNNDEIDINVPTKTSDLTNDNDFVESRDLANVATSGSYTDLTNKPTIPVVNDGVLTVQRNGVTVGTFSANQASDTIANISVPTKTSDLTNDGNDGADEFATEGFVNSSIATNTAYFRGTYNIVTDLGLTTSATEAQIAAALATQMTQQSITPTNNDYVFVSYPDSTDPTQYDKYERYKYDSSDSLWHYEYTLNNSTFTAAQWQAINSGITSGNVSQITTNKNDIAGIKNGSSINSFAGVESALNGKQDTLTFDNIPTKNSNNPVKSDGIYNATFSRVYRSIAEVSDSLTSSSTMIDLINAMANNSVLVCQPSSYTGLIPSSADNRGVLEVYRAGNSNRANARYTVGSITDSKMWYGEYHTSSNINYWNWGEVVDTSTAQTISGEKTFTAEKTNANKYHITANDVNSANLYGDGLVLLATNGSSWGSGTNGQYVFHSDTFRPSAYRTNLQDLGSPVGLWRTGYFGTQVRITSTADVGGTTDSTARAPLLIGTPTGVHLEFDANEIIAKNSANTIGELFVQTDGGRTTLGNTLNWTELDKKRADLKVKGQIYNYGANCSRGVDAGTNYAGYFKLAEAVIPNWFRGPKARIEISDCDGVQTATLVINGYLGNNGVSNSSQITLETSNALGTWQNRFFLVVRQDKTVRDANKVFELWYYTPSGTTYSRVFASFRYDVADIRAADPVVSKWNKFTRTSSVDQGYVSAGVVDLVNGFIPVGSFTASTFATTTYPDCDIYSDTVALQDRLSYLQIYNEQNSYSDTPATATNKAIEFIGKDKSRISMINTTIGATWNAINLYLRTKGGVNKTIEFVSTSTGLLAFDCIADGECDLGQTGRRWKNLYLSGSLNDGTNAATATNIIKSVCVCETAAATAAKVVTIPNYTLRSGNMISVYFINTNTATQPTLNINNTGAKPIYFDNNRDTATTALTAGWHTFVYNGTNYYTGSLANSPWTQIKQSGQAFTTSLRLYAGTYEFMVVAPSYSTSGYAMQYGTMTIPGSGFNIAYDILSTGFYLYHSTAGAYDVYICRGTNGALVLQDKYGTNNNGQPVSVWYRQIQ